MIFGRIIQSFECHIGFQLGDLPSLLMASFYKGDNFCDILFAFMHVNPV